jgi:quercetin dioxygenase-like cupin family protein
MSESQSGTHLSPSEGELVWLVGDLITVKVASEDTNGEFSIVEESTPPQGGPPPHLHQQEGEALYVLEGKSSSWLASAPSGRARDRAPTFPSVPCIHSRM